MLGIHRRRLRDLDLGEHRGAAAAGESKVRGVVSTISDITDRKFAEQALRSSEARFRRTFELAGSGIANLGLDGRFIRVNRSLCAMLGYAAEELVGRPVKEISHPDDRRPHRRAARARALGRARAA